MKTKTDKSDSELIAIFDGWFPFEYENPKYQELKPYKKVGVFGDRYVETFEQYQTSWDWLMPVVEKIDIMYSRRLSEYNMTNTEINRYLSVLQLGIICSKKLVFQRVVTFIKWYNSQNS